MNLKNIKENITNLTLRLQAVPGASPAITEVVNKSIGMFQQVNQNPKTSVSSSMSDLSPELLAKLQTEVITSSTKPMERCKMVCSIIFEDYFEKLDEVQTQTAKAKELLENCVAFAILSQFADSSGNISWTNYSKAVGKILTGEEWNGLKFAVSWSLISILGNTERSYFPVRQ